MFEDNHDTSEIGFNLAELRGTVFFIRRRVRNGAVSSGTPATLHKGAAGSHRQLAGQCSHDSRNEWQVAFQGKRRLRERKKASWRSCGVENNAREVSTNQSA